jgi:hypothetical protein
MFIRSDIPKLKQDLTIQTHLYSQGLDTYLPHSLSDISSVVACHHQLSAVKTPPSVF